MKVKIEKFVPGVRKSYTRGTTTATMEAMRRLKQGECFAVKTKDRYLTSVVNAWEQRAMFSAVKDGSGKLVIVRN